MITIMRHGDMNPRDREKNWENFKLRSDLGLGNGHQHIRDEAHSIALENDGLLGYFNLRIRGRALPLREYQD